MAGCAAGHSDAAAACPSRLRVAQVRKQRNVPVHYLVLEDECHGFSRTERVVTTYHAVDRFLDRYIVGDHSVKAVD